MSARHVVVAVALAAAMWLTRSHHFAELAHLPDASWAAFFVAGMIGTRWPVPVFLMANAGIIDYLALLGGVSDYCVTPAYPFLAPTYLSLWAAGRWAAFDATLPRTALRVAAGLAIGVAGAFVISNAGFYAFAGYFGSMPVTTFTVRVAKYFPYFLESTAAYTAAVALPWMLWRRIGHGRRLTVDG